MAEGGGFLLSAAALLLPAASASAGSFRAAVPVTSQRFEIGYRVNRDAEPLQAVELWYTRDQGNTWHRFGLDEDRRPPMSFTAPGEGLYGLMVVLYNAAGASSPRPASGTTPQKWVLVDYTPPVLQLHQARVTDRPGERTRVHVSWSAYDAHLPSRPIELSYRLPGEPGWTPIGGRMANVGRYDWLVPDGVSGPVEIRVLVRDRAGHVAVGEFSPVNVEHSRPPPAEAIGQANLPATTQPSDGKSTPAERPDPQEAKRAARLYELGTWFLSRGHLDVAEQRFLETLALDPYHKAARNDLAGILYRRGAIVEAMEQYRRVLAQDERFVPAARGLAMALAAQKRYPEAVISLRRILALEPSDPRTLLELGDVLLLGGEPAAARERWREVTRQPGVAAAIRREAVARLNGYATSSSK